jgi:hypothetical protein
MGPPLLDLVPAVGFVLPLQTDGGCRDFTDAWVWPPEGRGQP